MPYTKKPYTGTSSVKATQSMRLKSNRNDESHNKTNSNTIFLNNNFIVKKTFLLEVKDCNGGRKDLEAREIRRDGRKRKRIIPPDPLTLYFGKCFI